MLLTLGEEGLFQPRWSVGVLEEVRRHLPAEMDVRAVDRLLSAMEEAFPEAKVEWPGVVDISVRLMSNPKDRHVVAAALWSGCEVLVTADVRLCAEIERLTSLEPQRPDAFLAFAVDAGPPRAIASLVEMVRRRWLPEDQRISDDQVIERLVAWCRRRDLPATADVISRCR